MVFAHRSQALLFVFPGDPDWDMSQRTVNSNIVIKKLPVSFSAKQVLENTETIPSQILVVMVLFLCFL